MLTVLKSLETLWLWREQQDGKDIGFVPTMGALHEGHLSLIEKAKSENDQVIVSIFVNPIQFAPNEDYDTYPRPLTKDREKLEKIGVDALWAPNALEMYPEGFETSVSVAGITQLLEGAYRPHHFDGVTTVVNKLFNQIRPTRAYFGEKDNQQLQVISKMVRDMNINTKVIGCPIHRDKSGLALSSRNAYLSPEQLDIARRLNSVLKSAPDLMRTMDIAEAETKMKNILGQAGFDKIDYVVIRNAETLKPVKNKREEEMRVLAAAWLDKTRLIDNMGI